MSVSRIIPLFQLPIFAIESILRNSTLCDLVHFSFISKRCRQLIKRLKIRSEGLVVRVRHEDMCIFFQNGEKYGVGWYFNWTGNWAYRTRGMESPVTATIGGIPIRTFIDRNYLYSFSDGNTAICVEFATQYLMDLFDCCVNYYKIWPDYIPNSRYPLLVKYHQCQYISIIGKRLMDTMELRRILSNTIVTKRVHLNIPLRETFRLTIASWNKPKHIHIWKDAYWITRDMLFASNCTRMVFVDCELTANDCREFVRRWYNSNNTTFKSLFFSWKIEEAPENLNFENLGFELMPFDPERRNSAHRYNYNQALNLSTGEDILRSDGLLATVDFTATSFCFCVWHKRFPNMDGIKVDYE